MGSNLKTKINLRKDVLSSWTKADPVLGDGEMAIVEDESGQLAMKIGNGVSSFTQLPFLNQQELKTEKLTAKEATVKCISQGYSVSSTPTSMATGVFSEAKSSFGVAHGIEAQVLSSDDYAFVYSGVNQENIADRYTSHGPGTFSVNPAGGLSGFYVGEQSLCSLLSTSGSGTCEFNDDVKRTLADYLDDMAQKDADVQKVVALKKAMGVPVVESISLGLSELSMGAGDTYEFSVAVVPDGVDITTLEWSSSDDSVVKAESGKATAYSIGSATIAVQKDGVSASCAVAVTAASETYSVATYLTKCVISNSAQAIAKGSSFKATVTPVAGCKLRSVKCTMNGVSQTVAGGVIDIQLVTGNISIVAEASELATYSVMFAGSDYSATNAATSVKEDEAYSCIITPSDGYKLVSVTYTTGDQSYSAADGVISIATVFGDISISVETAQLQTFAVTTTLTNCTISNSATEVLEGSSFEATVTRNKSCKMQSMTCTMGGKEVEVKDWTVSIAYVTGDIAIVATAVETASYEVVNRLSNCVNMSDVETVPDEGSYSTRIAPADECLMSSVVCMMGDTAVSIGEGWTISVDQVTADIEISAVAVGAESVYYQKQDWQANNVIWAEWVDVDFWEGDYVEAKMNLSACTQNTSYDYNVLDVGIDTKWNSAGGGRYHFYTNVEDDSRILYCVAATGSFTRCNLALSSDEVDIKVAKEGVYVDGRLLLSSDWAAPSTAEDVRQYMQDYSAVTLGSQEGAGHSRAYYYFIKVVHAPVTLKPHCSVTYDMLSVDCSTSKKSFVKGQALTCTFLPSYTCKLGAGTLNWADGTTQQLTSTTLSTAVTSDVTVSAYAVQMESETISSGISSDQWSVGLANLDFSAGDLVEVSVDLAGLAGAGSYSVDIASFGEQIDQWAADGKLNVHWYASGAGDLAADGSALPLTSLVQYCTYSTWTCSHSYDRSAFPVSCAVALSKDGIWLNGSVVGDSGCSNANQHKQAIQKLLTLGSIQVGRLQQDQDKKVVLEYPSVKVYRADMAKRQTAES